MSILRLGADPVSGEGRPQLPPPGPRCPRTPLKASRPTYPVVAISLAGLGGPSCHLTVHRTSKGARIGATVTNTGSRAGADVAQLYLGIPSIRGVPQPPEQLKGFAKVSLRPGQHRRVSFALTRRALSYWNTGAGRWRVAPGCYRVMVGDSSARLPLRGSIALGGVSCGRRPGRQASAQLQLARGSR
jgi:hypothetical protein